MLYVVLRATSVKAHDDRASALLLGIPMFQHYAPSSYALTCALPMSPSLSRPFAAHKSQALLEHLRNGARGGTLVSSLIWSSTVCDGMLWYSHSVVVPCCVICPFTGDLTWTVAGSSEL